MTAQLTQSKRLEVRR